MKKLVLIALICLSACNFKDKSDVSMNMKDFSSNISADTLSNQISLSNNDFSAYLKNFKSLTFPIIIKGCSLDSYEGLKEFEYNPSRKHNPDYSYAYGLIPSNGNYIALLLLGVADCYLPVLTTYTEDGQIIDKKVLSIGYGEVDCGVHTEDFLLLDKDYNIYVCDTITYCKFDSSNNIIKDSFEIQVLYKQGKILADGKIELSELLKIILD